MISEAGERREGHSLVPDPSLGICYSNNIMNLRHCYGFASMSRGHKIFHVCGNKIKTNRAYGATDTVTLKTGADWTGGFGLDSLLSKQLNDLKQDENLGTR